MKNGFSRAERALSQMSNKIERLESVSDSTIKNILTHALENVKPLIRKYLMENFNKSEVGTKSRDNKNSNYKSTGKLKRAIQNIAIELVFKGRTPTLRLAMPSGIADYKSGKSNTSFYKVAASLNHGAVRTPNKTRSVVDLATKTSKMEKRSAIGSKAKRSLKKGLLSGKYNERAQASLAKGRKGIIGGLAVDYGSRKDKAKSVKVDATGASIVVVKPTPFFYLTGGQMKDIDDSFKANAGLMLRDLIGV